MQQQFAGQVNVVGVASRDDLPPMRQFVTDTGVDAFPHIADVSGEIWEAFGVTSQPSLAFINDDGTVEIVIGAIGVDGLVERMTALVAS
ncbi:MAG: redoxin domain-containing protein [Actinobacteria bacterium]|nr:redoxin domain-containing protein [Actinomycetota bacterium]NCG39072.1 redoxin domain-containing protein [Actinomycetota bacterium]